MKSSNSQAYSYLEKLQENILGQLGELNEVEEHVFDYENFFENFIKATYGNISGREFKKIKDSLIKEHKESLKNVPTKYESPEYYQIMNTISEKIEKSAEILSLSIPVNLIYGTLPTGNVNAMSVLVPSTKLYLVLFESQIFNFTNLFSKIIAASIPLKNEKKAVLIFPPLMMIGKIISNRI